MIYLTDYRTAWTDNKRMIGDIKYPQSVHMFDDTYARIKTGMVYPPHRVADKVLDPLLCEAIRSRPARSAFILAGGNANFAGSSSKNYDNSLSYTYKFLPLTLTQVYASRIAQSCGATDHITTDASACASSLKVMMDVQTLIDYYQFDRVVVLGIEDAVSNGVLEFFGEARASLSYADQHSGKLPSAFDSVNGGFHVAQGAVFAVFESDRIAASGQAELLSAYTASEVCSNAIGQDASGAGFSAAIRGALAFKGLGADSVSVVKTHGTGTQSNNQAERNSLNTMLPQYVATSYKPRIGHTMGVSGLLETCLLLNDIRSGSVPAILNRTEPDSVFLSEPHEFSGGNILSLAAGMGNVYSAAIWRFIK